VTSSPAKPHDDLEELARAATPGAWEVANGIDVFTTTGAVNGAGQRAADNDGWQVCATNIGITFLKDGSEAELSFDEQRSNARLIAAANPARILSLIGEVRELRADNEMWRRVATSAWNLLDTVEPNDPATAELWEALQGFRRVLEETK
jgi:hypothetical protein